ncbi:hypothetical protein QUB47_18105 [Microcoleus sp. AT9_B5]
MSQNFTIWLWGENLDRGCRECDRAQGWLIGTKPQAAVGKI